MIRTLREIQHSVTAASSRLLGRLWSPSLSRAAVLIWGSTCWTLARPKSKAIVVVGLASLLVLVTLI